MAVDLHQKFEWFDYFGVLGIFCCFWSTIFVLCLIFNFLFITYRDDLTAFEKLGRKLNMRFGPHSMSQIRRKDGHISTAAHEAMVMMNPHSKKRRHSLVSLDFKIISATNFARGFAIGK